MIKKLLFFLLLIPTAAFAQSSRSGRITEGTLAARPNCPGPAQPGDIYVSTDQNPVDVVKCSTSGWSGLGGGANPAGNNGDVQIKNGTNLAAGGENDNGTALNISRDVHTKGPNPLVDVTMFGARATAFNAMPTTTCTINSASTSMTVGSGVNFVNGDGIVCRGAGGNVAVATPSAPTVTPSSVVGPTGTGQTTANATGAITNQYCVVAVDIGGGLSPCSATTSVATANTLGAQSVGITSWTATGFSGGSTITIVTSATHTMAVGTYVQIGGDPGINGFWKVLTVPDNTHITFQTSNMTSFGQQTAGGNAGTIYYWNANHITWPEVTNAIKYYVYGRAAGAMNLIGVTTLQISTMCNSCISGSNPGPPALVANMFDDYGASMTQNIPSANVPDYVPTTPPVAAKNKDLVTILVSGAGTTNWVVANAAGNSVAGQTLKIDNTPNIQNAINSAALNGTGVQGVLFFPATGAQNVQYETNSPLQLYAGSIGTLSVQQAGQINLGDMMWTQGGSSAFGTKVNWTGEPNNPSQGLASFARTSYPLISSSRATPMIYSANKNWFFSNLNISNNQPNQGYTWIADEGGGIPGSRWDNIEMDSHGSNDTMIIHFLMRGDSNGGADFQFNHFAFLSGPGSQAPGVTTTPAFYGDGMPSPIVMYDVNLSLRTMYFRLLPQGIQLTIEKIYDEGGIEPMVGVFFTGGQAAINVEMRGVIADTMGAPMFTYTGNVSGIAKVVAWTAVGSGQPFSNGPPGNLSIIGASPPYAYGTAQIAPNIVQAMDGNINAPSIGSYAETPQNSTFAVPNPMQFFVNGGIVTPTCAVSAGGSANIGSYTVRVAPVFRNGAGLSEGAYGGSNTCTTTGGNQTLTYNWAAVPGAVGYDVAENNNILGCNAGFVTPGTNTTMVRSTNFPPCGFPIGSPGGGVASVGAGGVSTVALRLLNNFTNTIQPSLMTANRTQTTPDATGVFLLDTTTTTSAGLAPSPYDNFFRANGGLGANWSNFITGNGTPAISSNAVIGGNAGNFTTGAFWSATPFLNDQYAEATVAVAVSGGAHIGAGVRLSGTTSGNGYECELTTTTLNMYRLLAGGEAFVTNTGHTTVVGDRVRAQIIGTSLTCSVTSPTGVTQSFTQTVTDFSTGSPGMVFFQAQGTLTNWTGGSIPNNTAYVTTALGEQQFNGTHHFMGPTIFGNYPGTSTGSGLVNGQLYAQGGLSDFSIFNNAPVCTDVNRKYSSVCVTTAYDTFNRANGGLGANWTTATGSTAPTITTNQVIGNTLSVVQGAFYSANTFAPDQFAEITITGVQASASWTVPEVRMTAGNGYACIINNTVNSGIYKITSGTTTTPLVTAGPGTISVGDVLRLENIGTTLNCYQNGALIYTITDTSFASGQPGFSVFSNSTAAFDNWNGGNINHIATFTAENDWPRIQHFTTATVGSSIPLAGALASNTLYAQNLILGSPGALSNALNAASGNSGRVGQTSGALSNTHAASFDVNGNIIDSGFVAGAATPCTTTALSIQYNNGGVFGCLSNFTWASATGILTGNQLANSNDVYFGKRFTDTAPTGNWLHFQTAAAADVYKLDINGNTSQVGTGSYGVSPPSCTAGTGGGTCNAEGTAPTAGAGYDTLYAASSDHMLHQALNNGTDIPVPNRSMLTSTYTNATTTASNITGLSFSVAANATYAMTCSLYYQGSATTAGLDITITGPASPTSIFYSYVTAPTATSVQDSVASAFSTKLVDTTITSTTNFPATVTMGLRNGANAGTVQVQGSATGAGTVTVQAGSFCTIQ